MPSILTSSGLRLVVFLLPAVLRTMLRNWLRSGFDGLFAPEMQPSRDYYHRERRCLLASLDANRKLRQERPDSASFAVAFVRRQVAYTYIFQAKGASGAPIFAGTGDLTLTSAKPKSLPPWPVGHGHEDPRSIANNWPLMSPCILVVPLGYQY